MWQGIADRTFMNVVDELEDILDRLYTHQGVLAKRSDKLDVVIESINEFLDEPNEDPEE